FAFAVAVAFLSVIPEGNLLLAQSCTNAVSGSPPVETEKLVKPLRLCKTPKTPMNTGEIRQK
ncbi:MAG: hypothetical protein M3R43_04335, partial [Acidobacteriota bacterium]|nr:hypothetical protein [Acidobacteriota bacterium]